MCSARYINIKGDIHNCYHFERKLVYKYIFEAQGNVWGDMCKEVRRGVKEVFILDLEIRDHGDGIKLCKEKLCVKCIKILHRCNYAKKLGLLL